ncbi:MAG: serine/threonine protein kinase [Gemmatimonadales bacterium]|nr:serine/threonine protein kinase [Gemmatimonadales bacterium]
MSLWSDPSVVAFQESLIGRYSLERELGQGGMATVYLARDVKLDRPVAIKLLHQRLSTDIGARERFVREAKIAARLSHPHIVPIFAVESTADHVFIVMAVIDGETLGARVRRRGAMPPDEAERVLRETAWALGYAHAHGVIHRDLTPENILLERGTGRALLADFGIASELDVAESGPVFGTPGFLAPEVIRGDVVDHRSDIYALGVIAWTAVVGRAPFVGETSAQLLAKHLVQPVPSLAEHARGVSRRLVAAIEACMAKDADARPADTGTLLALLERLPEPIAIAPALRQWFTRWDRIKAIYALATPLLAMQTWLMINGYFDSGARVLLTVALITTVLTLTAIPVGAHLLFESLELRRLRHHGFGIQDIRAAFPHWRSEKLIERKHEGLAPLPGRVIFDLTLVGGLTIAATFGILWPNIERVFGAADADASRWVLISWMSYVYFATLSGIGIGFLVPGHRPSPNGLISRLKERLWGSRFADLVMRLSAIGQRGALAATSTLHRPTEMVLGLAVDDLWKALSPDMRNDLGDVPALVHTLRSSASEMRDLIERLRESEAALAGDGVDASTLISARERLEERHREAVAGLERTRLSLLKLVATRQSTAALTDEIAAARVLEAALLNDVAAHGEVRKLLRMPRRPTAALTPIPTPA